MKEIALKYAEWGLSIIPARLEDKTPAVGGSWKGFQQAIAAESDIVRWFGNSNNQIAIVCGKVSGNLEVLDFDNHFGDIEEIFNSWKQIVSDTIPELLEKLIIEKSQSGGFHVFYRSEKIDGNHKLARRRMSESKVDTIIETRGEGGYVLVAPSKGYTLLQNDFSKVPTISDAERECLLSVAASFNEVDTEKANSKIYQLRPVDLERPGDDFNSRGNHRDLLVEYGWTLSHTAGDKEYWRRPDKNKGVSATFNVVADKLYVFSSNAYPFEDGKTYDRFAIYTVLKFGDTSAESFKNATKELAKKGYGKPVSQKERKTKNSITIKNKPAEDSDDSEDIPSDNVSLEDWKFESDLPNKAIFWYEGEDSKGKPKLFLVKSNLINFLEHHGFYKYWIDKNLSVFVRIIDNIVTEETAETIIDFLKSAILNFPFEVTFSFNKHNLWESVLQSIRTVAGANFLATISAKEIKFLEDTKTEAYIPFKNGIVRVSKDSDNPVIIPYKDFDGCIWKDAIIQRKFSLIPEAEDTGNSVFGRFLEKVCSPKNKEYPDDRTKRICDEDRLISLMSSIGYLCHTYKDPTITKAIIYCEEAIADYDESNGRTGKGLTFNAISKIRKHHLYNGKQVDFNDKFFFQDIQQDTRLMVFDDVRKKFDFEALFSILTEGISVERKGQKPFKIPFVRSPKVLITTNSVISNDSGSHRARKFEIEFSDYFSADYTPFDEFQEYMFEQGWGDEGEQWDRFYSFMLYCVKTYLDCGLSEYEKVNLDERKLREDIPEEFLDFAFEEVGKIKEGETIYKDELFERFTNIYPMFGPKGKQEKSQRHTTKWFMRVLKFYKLTITEDDNRKGSARKRGWKLVA